MDSFHGFTTVLRSNLLAKQLLLPKPPGSIAEQTIIVSGSNTGLGFETSKHLSRMGLGTLIMAVRSLDKGEAAKKEILRASKRSDESIQVWHLDMDSHDSVKAFARRATDELPRLDGVLANAGIMTATFRQGPSGIENNLNVNVVSTFLLCLLLLPKLRDSARLTGQPGHFVTVNSSLHYFAPYKELSPDGSANLIQQLNNASTAAMDGRYALSKAIVLYVVRELAVRDNAAREKTPDRPLVIINSPNPSFCKSSLMRENYTTSARISESLFARETEVGCRTQLDGLFKGSVSHGKFLNDCHVAEPAYHISGKWGEKVQKKVFEDLLAMLETIQPGISANV